MTKLVEIFTYKIVYETSSYTLVWCDNASTTALASNPINHGKTKHIEIGLHFVQDKVLNKDIDVCYVCIEDQTANIFIKPITFNHFHFLKSNLIMQSKHLCVVQILLYSRAHKSIVV